MFKKHTDLILAALLTICAVIFIWTVIANAGEPVSENSGAVTTAKVITTGPGGVIGVVCKGDGSHACGCTLYDNATVAGGTQIPGAGQTATNSAAPNSWFSNNPIRFTYGLFVSPDANSTCFVSWLQGVR
jgi:hypothetical protein